jgi:hypothetical protein
MMHRATGEAIAKVSAAPRKSRSLAPPEPRRASRNATPIIAAPLSSVPVMTSRVSSGFLGRFRARGDACSRKSYVGAQTTRTRLAIIGLSDRVPVLVLAPAIPSDQIAFRSYCNTLFELLWLALSSRRLERKAVTWNQY